MPRKRKLDEMSKELSEGAAYACPLCPQTFQRGCGLASHMRKHAPVVFTCDDCNYTVKHKYAYDRHMYVRHGVEQEEEEYEATVEVPTPSKSLRARIESPVLSRAESSTTTRKPAPSAAVTPKLPVTTPKTLKPSITTQSPQKPYPYGCPICKKRFEHKARAAFHIQCHRQHKWVSARSRIMFRQARIVMNRGFPTTSDAMVKWRLNCERRPIAQRRAILWKFMEENFGSPVIKSMKRNPETRAALLQQQNFRKRTMKNEPRVAVAGRTPNNSEGPQLNGAMVSVLRKKCLRMKSDIAFAQKLLVNNCQYYLCRECPYTTWNLTSLWRHFRRHIQMSKTSYACFACSYSSIHLKCIQQHVKMHSGKPECDAEFYHWLRYEKETNVSDLSDRCLTTTPVVPSPSSFRAIPVTPQKLLPSNQFSNSSGPLTPAIMSPRVTRSAGAKKDQPTPVFRPKPSPAPHASTSNTPSSSASKTPTVKIQEPETVKTTVASTVKMSTRSNKESTGPKVIPPSTVSTGSQIISQITSQDRNRAATSAASKIISSKLASSLQVAPKTVTASVAIETRKRGLSDVAAPTNNANTKTVTTSSAKPTPKTEKPAVASRPTRSATLAQKAASQAPVVKTTPKTITTAMVVVASAPPPPPPPTIILPKSIQSKHRPTTPTRRATRSSVAAKAAVENASLKAKIEVPAKPVENKQSTASVNKKHTTSHWIHVNWTPGHGDDIPGSSNGKSSEPPQKLRNDSHKSLPVLKPQVDAPIESKQESVEIAKPSSSTPIQRTFVQCPLEGPPKYEDFLNFKPAMLFNKQRHPIEARAMFEQAMAEYKVQQNLPKMPGAGINIPYEKLHPLAKSQFGKNNLKEYMIKEWQNEITGQCEDCPYHEHKNLDKFRRHRDKHYYKGPHKCQECTYSSFDKFDVEAHMYIDHYLNEVRAVEEIPTSESEEEEEEEILLPPPEKKKRRRRRANW